MKTRKGFVLKTICKENVITAEGLELINFSKLISLNDTATFIWKKAAEGEFTVDSLVDAMLEKYDVDRETATRDVENLLAKWKELEIIED
ncbi:MAG: PqqD family protein [Bacteroidales bacterium]|nr:PqqD family protein [Bacteroidales bacterium]